MLRAVTAVLQDEVLPEVVMPTCPIRKVLKGQKALVTGANSGIGKGIALALAHAGADVVVNFRTNPEAADVVGTFPLPGPDAGTNGLTVWMPTNTVYVPKSTEGAKLEAAQKFLEFLTTPESCDIQSETTAAQGPYVIDGCDLPEDVPAMVSDMQPYFDEGRTNLALEFLSPIKGPALEQITVEVGSGIRSAADAAKLYDEDVRKQAKQLGLPNW